MSVLISCPLLNFNDKVMQFLSWLGKENNCRKHSCNVCTFLLTKKSAFLCVGGRAIYIDIVNFSIFFQLQCISWRIANPQYEFVYHKYLALEISFVNSTTIFIFALDHNLRYHTDSRHYANIRNTSNSWMNTGRSQQVIQLQIKSSYSQNFRTWNWQDLKLISAQLEITEADDDTATAGSLWSFGMFTNDDFERVKSYEMDIDWQDWQSTMYNIA